MTKSNATLKLASHDAGTTDIRDLISFKLAQLTTLNDRIAKRLVSGRFGLSLREFRTLGALDYLHTATTSVLARESFLDHAQVSRIVARLIGRGLVERVGAVTRGGALRPTKAGTALIRNGMAIAARHNDLLFSNLSYADQAALLRLVDRMTANAKASFAEVNGEISTLTADFALLDTPP